MPKHTSLSLDNANIWLWKLIESPKQLLALLSHLPNYALEVQQFRSVKRQSEWLATRVLLHSILGDNVRIAYNQEGAPHLTHRTSLQNANATPSDDTAKFPFLSISHSQPWVSIAFSTNGQPIGFDVEIESDRANKVLYKFLSVEEQQLLSPTLTPTALWCAKEATYKLCHHPGLLFLDQMILHRENEQLLVSLPTLQREVVITLHSLEDAAIAVAQFLPDQPEIF